MLKTKINSGDFDNELRRVYVTEEAVKEQRERYVNLADLFEKEYGASENLSFFISIS